LRKTAIRQAVFPQNSWFLAVKLSLLPERAVLSRQRRGIILAGGSGARLHLITLGVQGLLGIPEKQIARQLDSGPRQGR